MMAEIVEIAAKVSTPLGLAGVIAAFVFFLLRQILAKNIFPKLTRTLGAGILRVVIDRLFALALVAMILGFAGFLVSSAVGRPHRDAYRIRTTIVDPHGVPVEDARVWSSMGGEAKKVAGGWEIEIPASRKPGDGKLTVFATVASAFLTGQADTVLAEEYDPTVTIALRKDTAATVRGMVVNSSRQAIAGARVSIAGAGGMATTDESGAFVLPANAAHGQQVLLHVEKVGYNAVDRWHPAGDEPAYVTLLRVAK